MVIASGAASVAAALPASANEPSVSLGLPKAKRRADGKWRISVLVVAADDLSPVPGVEVDLNFWGTDGGFYRFVTDDHGVFTIDGSLEDINYWVSMKPPKDSRFAATGEDFGAKSEAHFNLLSIRSDGTYFPSVFRLQVHEAAAGHEEHKGYHVIRRHTDR